MKKSLSNSHTEQSSYVNEMAGGPGFEPELPGPEPGVLPLNYPPPRDIFFYEHSYLHTIRIKKNKKMIEKENFKTTEFK